jgi:sulfite exporter TauE/SafE
MFVSAFLIGLVGSLHCGVMCGPLVLAVRTVGDTKFAFVFNRVLYQVGRISAYALLGLFFGGIGTSLVMAGLQQWLSIIAGVAIILLLLLELRGIKNPFWKCAGWGKSLFRRFLTQRSYSGLFALGATNGLLPCGLVYVAGTAAAATGSLLRASVYMLAFGVGTLPVMLCLMLSRTTFVRLFRGLSYRWVVPTAVSLVALSLILRGLSLGIPYLSPDASHGKITCPNCR